MAGLDRLVDRAAALARQGPGERHRRALGESADPADFRIEQAVDVGGLEPEVGQGIERAAGGDRFGQEDGVDAARAGAGEDVDEDPQLDLALGGERFEESPVSPFAAAVFRFPGVVGAAGAGEPPHLLGNAVHIDRQADPAVADEGQTKLFFPHPGDRGRRESACRAAQRFLRHRLDSSR